MKKERGGNEKKRDAMKKKGDAMKKERGGNEKKGTQ